MTFRDWDGKIEWLPTLAGWFIGTVVAGLVFFICLGFYDELQGYRTFGARVACEAKREVPRRQFLSDSVVCIPAITRQDTTTVNLNTSGK